MTRAALYYRVSTDQQAERGASLDGQRQACRAFVEARGWELAGEWQDVLSGRDPERPGYRAMLRARATYDVIVVWKFDRLGRDEADFFATYAELKRAGRDVLSVTEPNESSVVRGILAVLAAEESRRIGERVKLGMRQRVRDGHWVGPPPFGYRLARDGDGPPALVADAAEAALYLEAVAWVEAGGSLRQLAIDWNRRGVGREAGRRAWYAATLAHLLRNPLHAGLLRWTGVDDLLPGRHEPLIDRARWERLGELLSRHQWRTRARGTRPGALLTGLFRCAGCGMAMVHAVSARPKRDYHYYTCRHHSHAGACALSGMVPCDVADGLVLAELAPALLMDAAALASGARRQLDAARSEEDDRRERERDRLSRRREALMRELAGYRRMLALEQVTDEEYRADRARCLAAIAEIDAALAALGEGPAPVPDDGLARVAGRLAAVGQLWPATTVEERRAFLADLGLQVWRHADRIEVRWPADVTAVLHGA